ncbi:fungal-specific transcription factor domain-containing protein [Mycena albidolilacea]|uniref:Fungal-specific transcription factor domain-containing protein n=1 Tax=Mycena albidolilacea TaxID=1033008 RepID=A0AAD7EET6_9AGAR|nr:fungal-specific transcription factor domain-containing protein [Mycena albidolilacea]
MPAKQTQGRGLHGDRSTGSARVYIRSVPTRLWCIHPLPYQRADAMRHTYTLKFPPNDHMNDLIDLYFAHENVYLPLLHRPTFARAVADGLHLRNDGFAGTLLLVCAIGSRWSTDPRIADPGFDCGWEWFDQVHLAGNSLLGSPTLYDLQQYCLAAQFLKASSMHQAWWTLVGVGLRLAQARFPDSPTAAFNLSAPGSRRAPNDSEVAPSPEWELQKRAFWILVYQDRLASSVFGHICSVSYLGFDTDLPLQVDDEHWDHPTHPFQQPAHTPSRVTFFNALMDLNHILGLSLQILYAPQTVRTSFSINGDWEAQAIAELDSALNVWRDRIPEHLRWDSMRGDTVFFDQSVALYCSFYYVQIMIHRPFISVLRRSPTALPSLTICTTAARACANAMDVQRRRGGDVARPHNLNAVFMAGLVLLLHISSDERSSSGREMTHVQKCMDAVQLCGGR